MDNKAILQIRMIDYGKDFGFRAEASHIFEDIQSKYHLSDYEIILIDFSNVTLVSSGFAFDFFVKLRLKLSTEFLKKIRVRFDQNDNGHLVKTVVKNAVLSQNESK